MSEQAFDSDADFYKRQVELYQTSLQAKQQGTALSADIAKSAASRSKYLKWQLLLLLFVLLCFVAILAYELIFTWLSYIPLIRDVDKYKPSEWRPSGYETALCIRYPGLHGLLRYPTPALALAVMFSMYSPYLKPKFMMNTTQYMSQMWQYATVGVFDPTANPDQNAMTIVCQSWACGASVQFCLPLCPSDDVSWSSVAMHGISVGIAGGFLGQMAGGKAGAGALAFKGGAGIASLVGFVVLGTTATVLSFLGQKHSIQEAKANRPACTAPKSTVTLCYPTLQ